MRSRSLLSSLVLAACAIVALDVLLAQAHKAYRQMHPTSATTVPYRIRSDLYHHDLAPMVDTMETWGLLHYPMRTNSLGFRDASTRRVPLQAARRRIVVIGAALAEGLGIPYEETFAGLIAAALAPRDIEVLNAAVAGYAPSIYYRKMRHLLEDVGLEFDELVVFLDPADIHDEAVLFDLDEHDGVRFRAESAPAFTSVWTSGADPAVEPPIQRLRHWLRTNSFAIGVAAALRSARYVEGRDGLPPKTGEPRVLWTTDAGLFDEYGREGLEKASRSMDRLLAVLRARSMALTVAVYPWPDQIVRGDRDSRQVTFWRQWAEARGVRFIDLFAPFFAGTEGTERVRRYYIPYDVHFNAAGHRLVAEQFLASHGAGVALPGDPPS